MLEKSTDAPLDAVVFGKGVIVYCTQHLRPHHTGWCTVGNGSEEWCRQQKFPLEATTLDEAADECRRNGYKLYGDIT